MKIKKFNFKKVYSTNKTAIKIINNTKLNYGMIVSESQKNGKGQYGRNWISFKGNLFVSFFYNIDNINFSIKKLTRINCLLVKKAISRFYKKEIFFKSPNDLLINKKKISGILQEIIVKDNKKYLVVGIGINIIKSPNITNYPTTNLLEIVGKKIDYKIMINQLKLIFEKNLSKYFKMKAQ
jgi:BirA family transcriptional regulator, biotin operon repressor / biotin---[acetyl-CoA-carboxylase] ligase